MYLFHVISIITASHKSYSNGMTWGILNYFCNYTVISTQQKVVYQILEKQENIFVPCPHTSSYLNSIYYRLNVYSSSFHFQQYLRANTHHLAQINCWWIQSIYLFPLTFLWPVILFSQSPAFNHSADNIILLFSGPSTKCVLSVYKMLICTHQNLPTF